MAIDNEEIPINETMDQRKMRLAGSPDAVVLVELLKDCRTQIMQVLDKDEFKTLVNALRLEFEAELIQRVVVYLEEIKQGKLHERK